VVFSAHLDDAVFSVGATMAAASRAGRKVRVVTAFAGDPDSTRAAGAWDRASGFRSAAEAVRRRRKEDAAACSILGAEPVWLSHEDDQYGSDVDDEALSRELEELTAGTVLVPGFPLTHPDHARLARVVLERPDRYTDVGLYVEQPYAVWKGRPATPPTLQGKVDDLIWVASPATPEDRRRKRRACLAYRSQLRLLVRRSPLVAWRMLRYERRAGGELVSWTSSVNRHR
jgi:LmbE family N-acetylglucosaminyl deacetylase